MKDLASPGPDGLRPELIAAYVDDELRPDLRAAVEAWLARDPTLLESLLTQRQLSARNWPFWQSAEPVLPAEARWEAVHAKIVNALEPQSVLKIESGNWSSAWLIRALAASVAALVLWFAFRSPAEQESASNPQRENVRMPSVASSPVDPLAEFEVLPIASAVEVDVQRVMGDPAGMFTVGDAPFNGPLLLASEEDVEVERIEDHPAWPSGSPATVPAPGDAPMIFAVRPR